MAGIQQFPAWLALGSPANKTGTSALANRGFQVGTGCGGLIGQHLGTKTYLISRKNFAILCLPASIRIRNCPGEIERAGRPYCSQGATDQS